MGNAPALDPTVIEGLRLLTTPGEPDVLTEVLRMFLMEAPKRMDRLRNAHQAGDIFAAFDGSEMVGAIVTKRRDRTLELALIGVSPTRQKQGIASWMIGRMEEVARGRGLATLSLNTAEIMEDRVRLYGRHGFVVVRRGPPEHGQDAHVRAYMEKTL